MTRGDSVLFPATQMFFKGRLRLNRCAIRDSKKSAEVCFILASTACTKDATSRPEGGRARRKQLPSLIQCERALSLEEKSPIGSRWKIPEREREKEPFLFRSLLWRIRPNWNKPWLRRGIHIFNFPESRQVEKVNVREGFAN